MALKINLKPDERIIVNGAVIARGEKAGQFIFLNKARILHQHHVLTDERIHAAQAAEGRKRHDCWFYFFIQLIYIDPENAGDYVAKLADTIDGLLAEFPDQTETVGEILRLVAAGNLYQALKNCRDAFPNCLPPKKSSKTEGNQAEALMASGREISVEGV